jgi:small GTP-binding protein
MRRVKLVVIGNAAVGKTCMLWVYSKGTFPTEYMPTVFENYTTKEKVNDEEIAVQLWDTAGQEDLDSIRTLSYQGTHVFLVTFAVNDKSSYEAVSTMWVPELRVHASPEAQLLLIGTKTNLRQEAGANAVSKEEGRALAGKIGAFDYVECSAMLGQGVKELFDKAVGRAVRMLGKPPKGEAGGGGCSVA